MIGAKFEIQINAVPRTYRDDRAIAIKTAQFLKLHNIKEEVKLIDLETRRWAMIVNDTSEPVWRDPVWEAAVNAKPL